MTDLRGRRFGRLLALKPLRKRHTTGAVMWRCVCSCRTRVSVPSTSLLSNHTKSCGCWHRDAAREQINKNRPDVSPTLKHGGTSDPDIIPVYRAYRAMMNRCYNPHARSYRFYGGAGVTVCDEWLNSFQAFLRDMGKKPEGTTLGRILDVGMYCRANCAWQTSNQQQEERRRKRHYIKNALSQAMLTGPYTKKRQRKK